MSYLTKDEVEAIDIAIEALQSYLDVDVEQDRGGFAIDVLCALKNKAKRHKIKKKRPNKCL